VLFLHLWFDLLLSERPTLILFDLTRQIVEEAERRVLNFKSKGALTDTATRNGLFPLPFLHLGIVELMRPMFKWAMFSVVLVISALLFTKTDISMSAKNSIFMLCIYFPLFLVVFAVPSTFSFDTISGAQVCALADYIFDLGFDAENKLDSLGECISLVAERTYARTKILQGVIAAIWGLSLYGLNQFTNMALKLVPEQSTKLFADNISAIVLFVIVTFLSLVAILGYKKANDAIFRRLSFAIEELKYRVAQS
jgi:hypothetical protein